MKANAIKRHAEQLATEAIEVVTELMETIIEINEDVIFPKEHEDLGYDPDDADAWREEQLIRQAMEEE